MNNVVGELAINRNGLSLQNQQLQRSVRELLDRFVQVQGVVGQLRKLSDQMLATPERPHYEAILSGVNPLGELVIRQGDFDSLELDRYGVLNSRLQELIEDMVQLEEAVDDVSLFAKQSNRTLEQQRQMLTQLRDELMWARMLPLSEVLNRFPRVLRDLSTKYHKLVSLNLSGMGVLVDKGALEKLYDPLLHLLRNAFDHGIESPEIRRQQGKPEQGKIEIRAYHQGSQTIIEVKDDGQGLDTEGIGRRAIELGLLSAEQLATTSNNHLFELVFEPGFSTAKQVSELSGRGVGLDVVRSQMRSLKGSITVSSSPGVGTTFTLHLPLTLTIAKLLVCLIGPTAIALPSDSVEEIVVPKSDQVKTTGEQRFLRWRDQIVPAYRLADILDYACPLPESSPSQALVSVPSPADWALPMLVLRQEQQVLALEIDRLVTEQELVIKPFGSAIAPPSFTYGCTILGDGSLIPVIDGTVLLDQLLGHNTTATRINTGSKPITLSVHENSSNSHTKTGITTPHAPTVLVVDDAAALRRTLALTLERAGCRVLQARDGREALEQLRQGSSRVNLVVCDIEMPNMNGFEFLGQRRQDPQLSKIPVVMLTSRSNDKHRWLAMRLGATAYFTKPYLEQEFLVAIKHIIDEQKPKSTLESSQNPLQLQQA
jgi:chemotaxis family two-component system sensor histidine kinase/response regulator PixL